jgi:hypothetical protein
VAQVVTHVTCIWDVTDLNIARYTGCAADGGFCGFPQPPAGKRWYGATVYVTATSKTFVILRYQTSQCCMIRATESIVKWNHLVCAEDRWYSPRVP